MIQSNNSILPAASGLYQSRYVISGRVIYSLPKISILVVFVTNLRNKKLNIQR
jgi:hypothetical protein